MFKRKNILSVLLASILMLSNTAVLGQEVEQEEILPEVEMELMDTGLAIPNRDASSWALDELVDSDRYGLYQAESLYGNSLKIDLGDELKTSLLENFQKKLENTSLEKVEKKEFLSENIKSKSRGSFLREIYNTLVLYEKEENLGKDPIMYLNHTGILLGNGKDLYLDRTITIEEAVVFTKRAVDYIYDENEIDTKGLMWKVENKGNTAYLLGSIHYGETQLYPFRKEVLNNFSDSEALFVEVDITNQEELMRIMMEKMEEFEDGIKENSKHKDGTTLKSQVGEEIYAKIQVIMEKYNIAEEEYADDKISAISEKISDLYFDEFFGDFSEELEEEFDEELEAEMEKEMEELMDNDFMKLMMEGPKLGVDFYFLDKAKVGNKKIGELESIESQIDLIFDGGLFGQVEELSQEDEIEMLKDMLESFDSKGNLVEVEYEEYDEEYDQELEAEFEAEMEKELEKQVNLIEGMFDAIREGNAEKLERLFIESEGEDVLGGLLIGERDKNMANRIEELLEGDEEKTYFVVVGAAHFVADGTIIDNLINKGYKVEKIK